MEPSTVVLVAALPVVYCIAGAARYSAIAKSARLAHRRPAHPNDATHTASVIALAAAASGNRGVDWSPTAPPSPSAIEQTR